MKTTAKLFIHGSKDIDGVIHYRALAVDMTKMGDSYGVLVDTVETEVEFNPLSEKEILDKVVDGLRKAKADIEAKAYMEAKAIQDKIDSLLCLEYTPEVQP